MIEKKSVDSIVKWLLASLRREGHTHNLAAIEGTNTGKTEKSRRS